MTYDHKGRGHVLCGGEASAPLQERIRQAFTSVVLEGPEESGLEVFSSVHPDGAIPCVTVLYSPRQGLGFGASGLMG